VLHAVRMTAIHSTSVHDLVEYNPIRCMICK
jgi:hypothetical protein